MKVIERIRAASKILTSTRFANYSLTDFENDFNKTFYEGTETNSGIKVDEESAKKFSVVYACIKNISEDIATMPTEIRKYKDVKNTSNGSDVASYIPLHDVVRYKANEEQEALTFFETMQNHALSSGNAYAHKEINGKGQVTSLRILNWQKITPRRNEKTGKIEYCFDNNGEEIILRKDEVFHLAGFGFDGMVGYSPVRMAMNSIGLGLAAEHFAADFFKNGANVGAIIELPNAIKNPEALRNELKEKYVGLGKSHQAMVLEQGVKYHSLSMPLAEAQFIENRRFQIEEIARIYRMPPHMVGDLSRATFSNIEEQSLSYLRQTLFAWIQRWESAINTQLLTKFDRQKGLFCRFNIDELLRADSTTRATTNNIKRQNGIITTNEWRASDNMNPREEKEADMLFFNGNMIPISGREEEKKEKKDDNILQEEK